ncbi:putative protease with the C-terminal PDZ domain [Bernardetia litoralis DSM 6794]|uniref:Putative protease with the C-terminal PDZ domain n=1 Tax=Bernardetia litoralis (strain ATCC 23117 / DSM 6794 / NBRC 15988 / NCIMB 1366 / Fx l1 / Sio-4) TaxID=880071 RepID=I4AKU6_BERLS|nr:M61 family metallopeptidase [Bernardetia litoralis]AFM04581.1 putative protease with the C-terminal PDZ domain [Bernardetia litoralis DSM 6794]
MLDYKISYSQPHHHFINLELTINNIDANLEKEISLQLPAWRPGRYTLQNFAKNIAKFNVFDENEKPLKFSKTTKDNWKVETNGAKTLTVRYTYYANQMDAGGSYLDEKQIYLNFICCCLEVQNRPNSEYRVNVEMPSDYKVACALPQETQEKKSYLIAQDFFHLIDSPLIASNTLKHKSYKVKNSEANFHIWIQGDWNIDFEKAVKEFQLFTQDQIALFKDFSSTDYHFMFQILPYSKYHGVEHCHSTVITLGADYDMDGVARYNDFLGISSHELFHFWNIMRIRPKELMPYDLSKETYFKTGFVAEGLTTYYGDYILCRSGVWTQEYYLKDFENLLKRHFHNNGRLNLSVADSSYDLWLDGYELGIPNRKSSIYVEGAMAAFILDIKLRKTSNHQKSLDTVMVKMWEDFGKKGIGYSLEDYHNVVDETAGEHIKDYFEKCIYSPNALNAYLKEAFDFIGIEKTFIPNENEMERRLGLKTIFQNNAYFVVGFSPDSEVAKSITVNDEIVAINSYKLDANNPNAILNKAAKDGKTELEISFFRDNQLHTITIKYDENQYPIIKLKVKEDATEEQKENLRKWLSPLV